MRAPAPCLFDASRMRPDLSLHPCMPCAKICAAAAQASNTITVWNNGDGVPVQIHKEEKVYVPEMIFGHLLTSSNYNDNEKKARPLGLLLCFSSCLAGHPSTHSIDTKLTSNELDPKLTRMPIS